MPRYVALLGSINVGSNRLTMADLRWAFEREGLSGIETVVASGNLLFEHDERPLDGLEDLFSHVMLDRFDIDSFVAIRDRDSLAATIRDNPFAALDDEARVHTLFLERPADPEAFARLAKDHATRGPEALAIGNRCLYIDYVEGVGGSRLSNAFIERRLGCRGTARNHRSLSRILTKMS